MSISFPNFKARRNVKLVMLTSLFECIYVSFIRNECNIVSNLKKMQMFNKCFVVPYNLLPTPILLGRDYLKGFYFG